MFLSKDLHLVRAPDVSRKDAMSGPSRRDIIVSAIALSCAPFMRHPLLACAATLSTNHPDFPLAEARSVIQPHEQLLSDFGWTFTLGNGVDPAVDLGFGTGQGDFSKTGDFAFAKCKFDDSKWRSLDLPHDWAVELPFVQDAEQKSHGFRPLRRRYLPPADEDWLSLP